MVCTSVEAELGQYVIGEMLTAAGMKVCSEAEIIVDDGAEEEVAGYGEISV